MVQAVDCGLLLYADDTGLIFQHMDIQHPGLILER